MPQQNLTNTVVASTDSITVAREAHSVSVTYQLERIKRGFDSLTLERLPGGLNVTKRVSTRGAVRTVTLLIPNELISLFLEEFAGLVESDDTDLGAPVPAVEHVAPRALIELHPAGGDLG